MRSSLLWKHVGITILTIVAAISVVWLAIDYLAADYFMALMKKYNISPTESNNMFLSAVHHYLLWASLFAFVLGVLGSFFSPAKSYVPCRI